MPGENEKNKIIEEAYKEIEKEIKDTDVRQEVLLVGDFNAKIKLNEQNESASGKILEEFLTKMDLEVINKSGNCKGMWTREEGDSKSVIDYVIASDITLVDAMIIDEANEKAVYYYKTEGNLRRKIL